MKGSDKVEMTINIGGELLKLKVDFDEQNGVRDAEREVKLYIDKLKKSGQDNSDRRILAMAAYQFAYWYHQLLETQSDAIELTNQKIREIEQILKGSPSGDHDD